jgi:hypothetical protein
MSLDFDVLSLSQLVATTCIAIVVPCAVAIVILTLSRRVHNKRQTLTVRDRRVQQQAGYAALQRQFQHQHQCKQKQQRPKKKDTTATMSSFADSRLQNQKGGAANRNHGNSEMLDNRSIGVPHTTSPAVASTTENTPTIKSGLVCQVGITRYCYIPHLPQADETAAVILQRLADEFNAIIQRRHYPVTSVSELCCCDSGLDYGELGGHQRRISLHQRINGVEQIHCGGYNYTRMRQPQPRSRIRSGVSQQQHTIHLRLRHAHNHNLFRPYHDIVETMCHELAHCEYHDHGPEFYQTMLDIMEEWYHTVR